MASSLDGPRLPRTRLRERDIEALTFIGRGYEVAQYQLHEAVFTSRSPNVVSRFVTRALGRGFIATERLGGIGMNRLRLTRRGREFLVGRGITEDELFAPAKVVALKDVAHTLAINDLRVALSAVNRPAFVWPAWFLQRRLLLAPAIPDVLARWRRVTKSDDLLFAAEIDLGGESLGAVFLPKLKRLHEFLNSVAEGGRTGIAVFTRGSRRVDLLKQHVDDARIPVMPFVLPNGVGSHDGILEFRSLLTA
jgi:hypothetical protein